MKKLIFACFCILVFEQLNAKPKTNVTIQGKVLNGNGKMIFIKNLTQKKFDTLLVRDEKFTFLCQVDEITPYILSNEENKYQVFFVEPKSNISIDYIQSENRIGQVKGSKSQDIFDGLLKMQAPIQQEASRVQQIYSKTLNQDSLNGVMHEINLQLKKNYYKFLEDNGHTEVAAFVVYSSIANSPTVNASIGDSMYNFLRLNALTSHFGKETKKVISKMKAVEVGNMAPDFTLPDATSLKSYSLSNLKGKYVLVDFWASWCGPCKQEIPFMKTAYEKFKSKGFEIMSVSLDDKKENWSKALTQFNMPWIQVSDSKGFGSIVNELYHIPSIPKTLLLDKTGKIIAADLRGNALEEKLSEIFGN